MSEQVDPFDLVKAEELMRGYHYRWKDEAFEVVGVESEFTTALRNPATGAASRTWRLGGKEDVLVKRAGLDGIVEHKTSAESLEPGGQYMRRLQLDPQVSIYFEGSAALGHDPQFAVYDVIGKVALRPSGVPLLDADKVKIVFNAQGERVRTKDGKKWRESASTADGFVLQTRPETPEEFRARVVEAIAAAPERYYQRAEVVRLEKDMEDARYDLWQLGEELREGKNVGRHPRNPDSCSRYGQTCSFFDACCGLASLDDPTLFKKVESVHQELSGAAADGLPLLTSSRLKDARACKRLHKFKYLDGYRSVVESDNLRFGTLMHRGLEAWWNAYGQEDAQLAAALAAIAGEKGEGDAPGA